MYAGRREDSTVKAEGEITEKACPACMAIIFNMCTHYMSILQIGHNCEIMEISVVEILSIRADNFFVYWPAFPWYSINPIRDGFSPLFA